MIDVSEWATNALVAVSERRHRKAELASLNKETRYLLSWMENDVVLHRVRNLMVDCCGRNDEDRFHYAVLLELRAAEEKAGANQEVSLISAVFRSFSGRIQWHKLYSQTEARFGPLLG